LARYGKLSLPTFLLLIAMIGGLAMFGPWGVALGPLLVRLAVEGLQILREQPEQTG
jgi:predicted PurR-regulated permease PerM